MPFLLIAIGLVALMAGVRNTVGQLATLVGGDLTGSGGNFSYWAAAILLVGLLGYSKPLRGLSATCMALIIIVLFVGKNTGGAGFFQAFTSAFSSATAAPVAAPSSATVNDPTLNINIGSGGSAPSTGTGSIISTVAGGLF